MDLDTLLGPSVFLKILDLFIKYPDEYMNMRAISSRINKNPGSVHHILPKLIERKILLSTKVSSVSHVYTLNRESQYVKILMELYSQLEEKTVTHDGDWS